MALFRRDRGNRSSRHTRIGPRIDHEQRTSDVLRRRANMEGDLRMKRRFVRVMVVAAAMRCGLATRLFFLHAMISRLSGSEVAAGYADPGELLKLTERLAPEASTPAWRLVDRVLTLGSVMAGTVLTAGFLGVQPHAAWLLIAFITWGGLEMLIWPIGRASSVRMFALAALSLVFLLVVDTSSTGPAPALPGALFSAGMVVVMAVPGARAVLSLVPGSVSIPGVVARSRLTGAGFSSGDRVRIRSRLRSGDAG
jgi:hypothetical protein